eukprot:TRINITY_DN12887_c0_g1_i1.p1 TRINITY_DN12887_c0_g1~~TRINITY_DN12887_c0_g1_i1.p1  ORF type:complete len:160 (-),score=9.54 TRINITY_DN12887_c0_g1_i1:186-665(-)
MTVTFMTIVTIYALFGDDIRVLSTNQDGDDYFYGVSSFSLAMFTFELILASYAKPGYFLGFFFFGQMSFQQFLQFSILAGLMIHYLVQVMVAMHKMLQSLQEQVEHPELEQEQEEQLEQLGQSGQLSYINMRNKCLNCKHWKQMEEEESQKGKPHYKQI